HPDRPALACSVDNPAMAPWNLRSSRCTLFLTVALFSAATPAISAAPGYDRPPQYVLDVLHAPAPPRPMLSPTRANALLVAWVSYAPMTQVAEPFLKLAGVRVEPRTRRKHDTPGGYGVAPCARSFALTKVANGSETKVTLPAGGCAERPLWAADGKHFVFRSTSKEAVELWV